MKKTQPQKSPSPRSSHARKPLLNITNLTHLNSYSSVHQKPTHENQLISKFDSTTNAKPTSNSQPKG